MWTRRRCLQPPAADLTVDDDPRRSATDGAADGDGDGAIIAVSTATAIGKK